MLTVPHLRPILLSIASDPWTLTLTIDAGELTFVDAAGMGLFADAGRALRRQSGVLRVVNARPGLRRVFGICGFDRTIEFVMPPERVSAGRAARTSSAGQYACSSRRRP